MEFETRAIHAGQEPDPLTGSVNVPIYQTSTYAQDGVLQMRGGHDYARTINPTRTALEQCLAVARGRRARRLLLVRDGRDDGDHGAVLARIAHGRDQRRVRRHLPAVLEALRAEGLRLRVPRPDRRGRRRVRPSSSRPTSSGSRRRPTRCSRSSTSRRSPSARTRPGRSSSSTTRSRARTCSSRSSLGADIVVHSTTKYIGGHSDSVGGVAITNDDETAERLHFVQNSDGRRAGPARLLPHAARRQDARGAHGAPLRQRRA